MVLFLLFENIQNAYFGYENNFNSDVAKMWDFLPITHMLTPHIKRKKCKKKLYILLHETHDAEERKESHDVARKKRETKEEEGRNHGAEQTI